METKGYAHIGQLKIFFLHIHIAKIFLRAKHTHTHTYTHTQRKKENGKNFQLTRQYRKIFPERDHS